MSRAAAATAAKGAQKAALKDKAEGHAADLAMGLTSTMKKAMAGDTLLCSVCGATTLGPKTVCECSGGRTKNFDDDTQKKLLLAAALERQKISQKQKMAAGAAAQSTVRQEKEKRKAAKDNIDALAELDLSSLDMVEVSFEPGKLGMSIEKNGVKDVAPDGAAAVLKVCAGWIIRKVGEEEAPPDKNKIMKLCMAAMKGGGKLTITFQIPLEEGHAHCSACDKFLDPASFEGATNGLETGAGTQTCCSCEEYGDMFG